MITSTLNRDAQLSTLANAGYLDNLPTTIGSWTRIGDPQPTASGFFGVAYYNSETKQVVVSFRGTDGAKDLLADTTFKTGGWNQQFTDAAAYTASVKAEIASKPREYPGGATMLTTGHSLGGSISQIIAKMFGLNGSSYEAPGASSVTANAQYAAVKAQYASDSTGTIGSSFTNYRAEGSCFACLPVATETCATRTTATSLRLARSLPSGSDRHFHGITKELQQTHIKQIGSGLHLSKVSAAKQVLRSFHVSPFI